VTPRRVTLPWAVLALLAIAPAAGHAWGDRTHPAIVHLALETLPEDVAAEFRRHRKALERFSNEPDNVLRQRYGREESIRHYIDLDGYMPAPFVGFPQTFKAAVEKLGKSKVEKYGVLPWVIFRKQRELQRALADRDGTQWVRVAGHLAHYVGDAYQPLHLTLNFDGQHSGSKGIHRRYENDVADAHIRPDEKAIRPSLSRATVPADIRRDLFAALFATFPKHVPILAADKTARRRGGVTSSAYKEALRGELEALTREQLRDSAVMLGNLWLASWRGAGR
jgi:hypothetical protein